MSQMYKKKAQENPDKYGKNGGQSWTDEEHEQLLKEVKKKTISEIAIIHKRTENAISARLKYLARKMIYDGDTTEEAQNKVKLVSVEDIQKFIGSENHKKEVKENNKEIIKKVKGKNENIDNDIIEELENKIIMLENKNTLFEDKINKLEEQIKLLMENNSNKKIKVKNITK